MSPRRSSSLTLEHVLLFLLEQKPMHGYELYQELCQMKGISLIWNIKQAMLYALLDKLEGNGFLTARSVQGEAYPPRIYFSLTELGKNALHTWIKTPVRRARDLRQEFLAKLIIARQYGQSAAMELIRSQEQACKTWLAELKTNVPPRDTDTVDDWLVYSFRLNRVEAVSAWLKLCEDEIDYFFKQDQAES